MKFLIFFAVVMAVMVAVVSGDCAGGAEACTQDYVSSAIHFRTHDDICGGAEKFIDCYKTACEVMPQSVVDTMQTKIAAAGIQCNLHA